MSEEAAVDEQPVTFVVKTSGDAKFTLTVPLNTTVSSLKEKLSASEYASLPPERQRLIYSGRVLKDADTLGTYRIKEGHTVHLVKGAESNVKQNPANQGSSASSTPAAPAVPMAAGTGANNLLAGLTGARYAGHVQLPNQSMFGPDGGMGPPPDPEHFANMLQNNPAFRATLDEALSNPAIIDEMIRQNPMMAGMGPQARQMMQNPEFRRMMLDPDAMRQMSRMSRMMGLGPQGGAGQTAFPAPGVTDTTPADQRNAEQRTGQSQPPPNPFGMFGPPGAGGQAVNPFAALFNPATMFGNTPATTPPPPVSADQGTPHDAPGTPGETQRGGGPGTGAQAQANPFANPFLGGTGLPNNPVMQNAMQNLMQNPQLMQQVLGTMYGGPSANLSDPSNPSAPDAPQNPFAALLGGMGGFGGPGGGGGGLTAPPDTRPPEERYAEQLRQLNDMGFFEFERNVEALRRSGGSVQGAVEDLLTR